MNHQRLRHFVYSLAIAASLLVPFGFSDRAAVQAQSPGWERSRDRRDDRRDERRQRREQEQKGYHDGLDRGREDARDHRSFNPNNSSHYKNGNGAYRDGFRKGYAEGFREYRGRRRY